MPEINVQQTESAKKKRGCGCNFCCLFLPYANTTESEVEQVVCENTQDTFPHYVDDLPDPLVPGTIIKVTGFVRPDCSRFAVNLCCNRSPSSDIALHLNPRISQRYVVRNSRIKDHWGSEEVTSITKFELARNKQIHIDIVVADTEFLISINGKHVCAFVYRIPIETVKAIVVEGPVDVSGVEYGKTNVYPVVNSPIENIEEIVKEDGESHGTSQNYEVPLTLSFPTGFDKGWQLDIQGRVKILPANFFVNLQDGPQLWPHPNIYLHLSPRFAYLNTRHVFVRNSWLDGDWGPEERVDKCPFTPSSTFSIAIRSYVDHFSIWVNGQLAGEFKYRGDPRKANTLYIQGDVIITGVVMRHNISDKYFTKSRQSIDSM
ncbi:galectin-8-like isoform X1 [Diabrotica virgifera virgifera]|uniref:Galectin n=1 Tax=Diabrotica virgifera virgifera TaxID=50390 RepID=A0A6P7F0P4_DIAVI|nr:galectin-8-like isoform X1 [Diabrotica virgifera virgifera]